jgi:hypothetical protein
MLLRRVDIASVIIMILVVVVVLLLLQVVEVMGLVTRRGC